MILGIRTDKPEAELLVLDKNSKIIDRTTWHGHRQLSKTLHVEIKRLLQKQSAELKDISGVVVYKGPGSFTGLRIGISVANALSAGLAVPIASGQGDEWYDQAVQKLSRNKNEKIVVPDYGGAPHTTKPKK